MEKYNSSQSDFQIQYGDTAILGFQKVISDPSKVFVWVRGSVDRPKHSDRHKTTKMANLSFQRVEWAKSVWLIDKVLEHFGGQLAIQNISRKDFEKLQDDELADKWVTKGDGERNFLKAVIMNPISEVTGEYVGIQVTQHEGTTPRTILERAKAESFNDPIKYERLLAKYQDKALVRTYVDTMVYEGEVGFPSKELVEVYTEDADGRKYPVYETNEVTLGEPHHIFLEYKKPNKLPKETLEQVQARTRLLRPQAENMTIQFPREEDEHKQYVLVEEDIIKEPAI